MSNQLTFTLFVENVVWFLCIAGWYYVAGMNLTVMFNWNDECDIPRLSLQVYLESLSVVMISVMTIYIYIWKIMDEYPRWTTFANILVILMIAILVWGSVILWWQAGDLSTGCDPKQIQYIYTMTIVMDCIIAFGFVVLIISGIIEFVNRIRRRQSYTVIDDNNYNNSVYLLDNINNTDNVIDVSYSLDGTEIIRI